MIRVLHIVGRLNRGGIETLLMNIYRNLDREEIQFDFLIQSEQKGAYEDEIRSLGGRIYRIPAKRRNLLKNMAGTIQVVKDKQYQIVHRHSAFPSMWLDLLLARIGGAKVCIAHSHNVEPEKWYYGIWRECLNKVSDIRFACAIEAGKFMYGRKQFDIVKNAIILEHYQYNESFREEMREIYKLKNKKVIGHIGRFGVSKNHKFLLDIFEDICKSSDDYRLVLIGIDENEQFFKTYIKEKRMEGKIIVLPPQEDVWKYYQMMDIFVFPSINEGLGMVLIEAQVSGLRCLVSEAIPPEAFVTSRIESMNLSEGVSRWADRIQSYQDLYDRRDHDVEIESYGYSAKKAAKELENIYKGSLEKR